MGVQEQSAILSGDLAFVDEGRDGEGGPVAVLRVEQRYHLLVQLHSELYTCTIKSGGRDNR